MPTVNLTSFKRKIKKEKTPLRRFLAKLETRQPKNLEEIKALSDKEVWASLDCLDCANCCKTMSPTYTGEDIRRISKQLGMSQREFREKWLYKDRTGDWINKKQPCQFLDTKTNLCNIYAVRPRDCAGFPHHNLKKMNADYMHMYKQNLEYCPATYRLVISINEKLGY